jgi:FKBP-type peptidyl-prolyl cis-trans isomerase FkpA
MKAILSIIVTSLFVSNAYAQAPADAQAPAVQAPVQVPVQVQAPAANVDVSVYRALGAEIGKSLKIFELNAQELGHVVSGLQDQISGAMTSAETEQLSALRPKIQELAQKKMEEQKEKNKKISQDFLAVAATKPGAQKTASGLIYTSKVEGTGPSPKAEDTVKVHYRGTLTTGEEFDSSYKRNEPTEFPLNRVIKCWTEGVQLMKVGGKAELICPAEIAYGDRGTPGIPPSSTLVFEVELIEIKPATPAPAPVPVPAVPAK